MSAYENAFRAVDLTAEYADAPCPFCGYHLTVSCRQTAGVPGDHVIQIRCPNRKCRKSDIERAVALGMPTDQVVGRRYAEVKLSRSNRLWRSSYDEDAPSKNKDEEPSEELLNIYAASIRMVPCIICREGFINGVVKDRAVLLVCSNSRCRDPMLPPKNLI